MNSAYCVDVRQGAEWRVAVRGCEYRKLEITEEGDTVTGANSGQNETNIGLRLGKLRTGMTQSSRQNDNSKEKPSNSEDPEWRVSAICDGGACVMVARYGESVVFGNSAEPSGPLSVYTSAAWRAFLAGVKLGDFDGIA
jgi:hypothetical protein